LGERQGEGVTIGYKEWKPVRGFRTRDFELNEDLSIPYRDIWGKMRKESIPIDNQIRKLFGQGHHYYEIRAALGLSYEDLPWERFLKVIGARYPIEYGWKLMSNRRGVKRRALLEQGYSRKVKAARERDMDKCALCPETRGLVVHHINPLVTSKNSNLDNLITLCREHHGKAHTKGKKREYAKKLHSLAKTRTLTQERREANIRARLKQ